MIGVFDSGYGGLTILQSIRAQLPQYDYIYLGDNARAPYGSRSFDVVYDYTLQCVKFLFDKGCHLVILACNTASAKALRTIQQHDLPLIDPDRRVLGVIRPTVEIIDSLTQTRHIGIVATEGTVQSQSYIAEISKLFSNITVAQQACPLWVPLIENSEHNTQGADFFIEKYLHELYCQDPQIDTIILGCTHYPLIKDKIEFFARQIWQHDMNIVAQGNIVAHSLDDYLHRHKDLAQQVLDAKISEDAKSQCLYYTTENTEKFNVNAHLFLNEQINARQAHIIQ